MIARRVGCHAASQPDLGKGRLIIALDLYLQHGQLSETHPEVVRVSGILNDLPIHTTRPDSREVPKSGGGRAETRVLPALDPAYPGVGMSRGGRGDAAVWDEFSKNPAVVRELAAAIQAGATADPEDAATPEEGEDEVDEGRVLYRLHRARERNRGIIRKKKAAVRAAGGSLACEACGIVFGDAYGPLGEDYIEVHHRVPLHASGATKTRLADLALICANCHRMIHRSSPWLTVEQLAEIVAKQRA